MEWNTVEKAIRTETDTRTEYRKSAYTVTSSPREGEPAGTTKWRHYNSFSLLHIDTGIMNTKYCSFFILSILVQSGFTNSSEKKSETQFTASVLKEDQNTQRVKNNTFLQNITKQGATRFVLSYWKEFRGQSDFQPFSYSILFPSVFVLVSLLLSPSH